MKQKINYIGSKFSLIDFIYEKIKENVPELEEKVFCDLFAGTNIISIFFKDKVKTIISNDIEYYSYVLAQTYLHNNRINQDKLKYLNNLKGEKLSFYNYYCENGKSNRLYFNENNGMKIDAIRTEIDNIKNINIDEYYTLISSLLETADKVANTASIYGAYLKKIKKSAKNPILLKKIENKIVNNQINKCYNEDSNLLIEHIEGDILYIDPPYNHRQYGSNYHILNMIAKYDFTEEPRGIVGLTDYNKSKYSSKTKAKDTFADLIKKSNFEHIFISYNNEGIINIDDMKNILTQYGNLTIYKKNYKTYKSDSKRNNKSERTIEYLFYLKKSI